MAPVPPITRNIDLAINALTLVIQVLLTRTLLTRFGVAPLLLIPGGGDLAGLRPAHRLAAAAAGGGGAGGDAVGRILADEAGARDPVYTGGP